MASVDPNQGHGARHRLGGRAPVVERRPWVAVNAGRDEWNYQVRDLAHTVQRFMPEVTVTINNLDGELRWTALHHA